METRPTTGLFGCTSCRFTSESLRRCLDYFARYGLLTNNLCSHAPS